MPRPLRPVAEGLIYHVINRGNNRGPVFLDPGDYAAFLEALGDLRRRRPFLLHGYCLMANHIHLLIRPLETPISRLVQSLLVSHTQRFHRCHRTGGHVWQGRFKSPVVQDDDHLLTVLRYIEANPLRAGVASDAGAYPWSSFAAHGRGTANPLVDPTAPYENLAADADTRRRIWSAFLHQEPPGAELESVRRSVRSGLPFGDPAWVEGLGQRLGLDLTIRPRGRPRKEPSPTPGQHGESPA